jgi:hypothetical protein
MKIKIKKQEFTIVYEHEGNGHAETHTASCVLGVVANLNPCIMQMPEFRLIENRTGRNWNRSELHRYVIQQSLSADVLYDSAKFN